MGVLAAAAGLTVLAGCSGSSAPQSARRPPPAPSAHTQAALACERAQDQQLSVSARTAAALPYAEAAARQDAAYRPMVTILQQLAVDARQTPGTGSTPTSSARSSSLQAQLAATCSQALQP